MKVSLTGTPGVGKTSVAKQVAEKTDLNYISLNNLARENECIISEDPERDTDIIDIPSLRDVTSSLKDCIFDGHLSHFLETDKTVVLRCKPNVLKERLGKKGWSEEKIQENVDAEIIGIIENEARGGNKEVYTIDTSERDVEEVVKIILNIIKGKGEDKYKKSIDWIEKGEL